MQLARPLSAMDPKRFGRARVRLVEKEGPERRTISSDLSLFATTFLAGFLVTSILIG
jgi:hypothetical protein